MGVLQASAIESEHMATKRRDAHTVRVPVEGRWEAAEVNARTMSGTPTSVINQFLAWYNRDPSAQLPARPAVGDTVHSADMAARD